jgi:hypothetical protein
VLPFIVLTLIITGAFVVVDKVGIAGGAVLMGIGYFLIDSHAHLTRDAYFKVTGCSALVLTAIAFSVEGQLGVIAFASIFVLMTVPGALFIFPVLSFSVRQCDSPTKVRSFSWVLIVLFVVFSLLFTMYQEKLEEPRKKAVKLTSALIDSYQANPELFRQHPAGPVNLALTDIYGNTEAPFIAQHGNGGNVVVTVGDNGVTVAYKNIPPGRFCRNFIMYTLAGFNPIKKGFIYKCQSDKPVTLEFFATFESMSQAYTSHYSKR